MYREVWVMKKAAAERLQPSLLNRISVTGDDLFSSPLSSPLSSQLFSWLVFSWPLSWLASSWLLFSLQLSLPPCWVFSSLREISSSVVSARHHHREVLEEQAQALP